MTFRFPKHYVASHYPRVMLQIERSQLMYEDEDVVITPQDKKALARFLKAERIPWSRVQCSVDGYGWVSVRESPATP